MATITIRPPEQMPTDDPYFYGWRMATSTAGKADVALIPLTEADVLHPREEDHVTQDDVHAAICRYLAGVAEGQLPPGEAALVLQDVLVIWDTPDRQRHSPDVAVVLGARRDRRRPSFDVAKESVRPVLVFEVTSAATARIDRAIKRRQYAQRGVEWYILVDLEAQPTPLLRGYHLQGNRYTALPLDAQGRLWIAPLRVWLTIMSRIEVACYDEQGDRIGDFATQQAARHEAERRVAELSARLQAQEEELRRLRGEA